MSKVLLIPALIVLAEAGLNFAPANAYFASRATVSGNTFSTGTWDSSVTETTDNTSSSQQAPPNLDELKVALVNTDEPTQLYGLMSSNFKSLFSADDFGEVWGGGASLVSVEYLSPPTQTLGSDWYEQPATITFTGGVSATYNLIFHLENGAWKLYATEEL